MKRITFIIHGKLKKAGSLISGIQKAFSDGFEMTFQFTNEAGHARELAFAAVTNGVTHIISVGGDGSLNEVVNGVMDAGKVTMTDTIRVGVLTYGTGNDFAKTVKAGKDLERLKYLINQDNYRNIDLGFVEFNDTRGQRATQYFINITDVGMGGVVVEKIANSSKFLGANLTYQKAIISTLLTYKNQSLKIKIDDHYFEAKVMNLIIANGKYFGSGLGIAPDADPSDGKLSVVVLGDFSIIDYLKNLGQVGKCEKILHPELKYMHAHHVFVEHVDKPQPIDMDGEFIGYSPMKISIVPGCIKFIC